MTKREILDIFYEKLKVIMKELPPELPEYTARADGMYFRNETPLPFSHIGVWMTSFFMGEAALAYEMTGAGEYLEWLEQYYPAYYSKVFMSPADTMHDLGFLYTLYAVPMYRYTGQEKYRTLALKAADELVKRYRIQGEYIRAWGRMDDWQDKKANEAIIDCMMNLGLLFWASLETGNPFYRDIALKHADTTKRCFIRRDKTTYHAYAFDAQDGKPVRGLNHCGYADESYWARGASWAVYGFANVYRHTQDKRYLQTADELAGAYLDNLRRSKESMIPVWDFRCEEAEKCLPDTSAAAIMACAFLDLAHAYRQLDEMKKSSQYESLAGRIIAELSDAKYLDTDVHIPGLIRHSNGLGHYTLFGDYFYAEALVRLEKQAEFTPYW